ncbi:hypothetical protein ACVWXM_008728 [Bradyrhizobium sp. GM7.3]
MKIIEFRPSRSSGKQLGTFDAEIAPGVRALDLSLIRKPDGSYRVFGTNIRLDIGVANDLAQAAVVMGGGSRGEQ